MSVNNKAPESNQKVNNIVNKPLVKSIALFVPALIVSISLYLLFFTPFISLAFRSHYSGEELNDYIFDLGSSFTLVWSQKANVETPGSPFLSFNSYRSGNVSIESRDDYAYKGLRFRYGGSGNGHVIQTGEIHDGEWHHIAWLHDGTGADRSNYSVFVDGVKVGTATWSESKDAKVLFEKNPNFDGSIKNVKVFEEILDAEEVACLAR